MDTLDSPTTPQRDDKGRLHKGVAINPTGKGGFGDHPENRNDGRWDKRLSRPYLLNKFQRMTQAQLQDYITEHKTDLTVIEQSCIEDVLATIKKNSERLKWVQEVADRTEGKPRMQLDNNVHTDETPTINLHFK